MIAFRSKSGGIHLYLFLTEEVPALLMREKLHSIKNIFGVEQPDKIFSSSKIFKTWRKGPRVVGLIFLTTMPQKQKDI